MDKETIRQQLNYITQEEIPDVNLLPNIEKQLKQTTRSHGRKTVFTLTRVAAVAAILLLASVAGATIMIQTFLRPDTIPEALLQPIDETQMIEGMTATLNWAYADQHRIALEVNTRYDATETSQGNQQTVTLMTADGQEIPANFGGGGGGNSPSDMIVERAFMSSFDARGIEVEGNEIDLVLTMTYGYAEQPAPTSGGGGGGGGGQPPANPPASGGGGGGGGGEQPPAAAPIERVPESDAPERTFVFEFSIPYIPALDGTVMTDTQTLDDISVTISDVGVTPSMTVLTLCSDYLAEGWTPYLYLQSDAEMQEYIDSWDPLVLPGGERVYGASPFGMMPVNAGDRCREMAIQAPFNPDNGNLNVILDGFYRATEEDTEADVQADIAFFAEQGFDLSYEIVEPPVIGGEQNQFVVPMSMSEMLIVTINGTPDTMTEQQARSYLARRMLTERIDGRLVYEIDVE